MQGLLEEERGSTRLALGIAVAVMAVLALVAVPLVVGQGHNAQDARAKSAVTRLAEQVEACRVTAESYQECDQRSELGRDRSVHWGRRAGTAGLLTDRSGDQDFTAYAVSGSGARIYVWTSHDGSVARDLCRHGSVRRLHRDGCDASGW